MEAKEGPLYSYPVHRDIREFDNDIALKALPIALRKTADDIRTICDIEGTSKEYELLLDSVESRLSEGLIPEEGYNKDVYCIKDFPIGHVDIFLNGCLERPINIYLLKLSPLFLILSDAEFDKISPKILNEFGLEHIDMGAGERPHHISAHRGSNAWYSRTAVDYTAMIFAKRFEEAYTFVFLESMGKLNGLANDLKLFSELMDYRATE